MTIAPTDRSDTLAPTTFAADMDAFLLARHLPHAGDALAAAMTAVAAGARGPVHLRHHDRGRRSGAGKLRLNQAAQSSLVIRRPGPSDGSDHQRWR